MSVCTAIAQMERYSIVTLACASARKHSIAQDHNSLMQVHAAVSVLEIKPVKLHLSIARGTVGVYVHSDNTAHVGKSLVIRAVDVVAGLRDIAMHLKCLITIRANVNAPRSNFVPPLKFSTVRTAIVNAQANKKFVITLPSDTTQTLVNVNAQWSENVHLHKNSTIKPASVSAQTLGKNVQKFKCSIPCLANVSVLIGPRDVTTHNKYLMRPPVAVNAPSIIAVQTVKFSITMLVNVSVLHLNPSAPKRRSLMMFHAHVNVQISRYSAHMDRYLIQEPVSAYAPGL